MEVDTLSTDAGSASKSPLSANSANLVTDKTNGDDDLGFTITMNESDDEASNDVSKESLNDIVQVNGKSTLDEDSHSSSSNDTKKCVPEKKVESSDNRSTDGGVKKGRSNGNIKSNQQDVEAENNKQSPECSQKDTVVESTVDDNLSEQAGDVKNSGKDSISNKNTFVSIEKESSIIEIEDSPMKKSIQKKQEQNISKDTWNPSVKVSASPMVSVSVPVSNTANIVLDARTGASIPYMMSAPGASLVPSSSGVQLVLPQGTPGVQGSAVMYVPNSGAFLSSPTSSTSLYLPSTGTSLPPHALARSTAPLLFSHYTSMMPNQANKFFIPAQSQAIRPSMAVPPVLASIPEKPTSSIGMLEMIRWEVENHINIKPKYVKPNPKAELGNLAKWIFDLGADMVKEYVYHDLVRIQHRRKNEGNLSAKEKDDFAKLQDIDKDLNQKVGHLKYKLSKSCKCGFKTELDNVLYNHTQHAHIQRGGFLTCALCKFSTRQPNSFRFHMEVEHGRVAKMEARPSFFECSMCPYETNYTNRLEQHKLRCQRQFREAFNLHPSCMTGPEVNLCLENVFYFVFTRQFMNSIIPKPPLPAVSSSTKIRDMPTKQEAVPNALQSRKTVVNCTSSVTPAVSCKQMAPRLSAQFQQRINTGSKPPQPNTTLSHNFPVISSKINTVPNHSFSAFSSGVPRQLPLPSRPSVPTRPLVPNQLSVSIQPPVPPQPPVPNQPNSGFEVCEICGGYVKDRKALRIHFFYAHRIDMPFGVFERPQPPLYCATCFSRFWTAQGLQKHIEVHKNDLVNTAQASNGVAGKCISCGHRVPNILMHMRMVHNRELRHYLAALMCIFCGNRFGTKSQVEHHMGKMHGVIVKNSNIQGSDASLVNTAIKGNSVQQANMTGVKQSSNAASVKSSSGKKANRSSQCVLCNLSFYRNVDLTRHCMRVHHTCMKCGLVVVDKESLSRHTCLHSASGMRSCQICKESGFHPAYYIKHMRDKHLRKCSVVLRRIDRAVVETLKRPITISDSEDDEPVSKQLKSEKENVEKTADNVKEEVNSDNVEVEDQNEACKKKTETTKGINEVQIEEEEGSTNKQDHVVEKEEANSKEAAGGIVKEKGNCIEINNRRETAENAPQNDSYEIQKVKPIEKKTESIEKTLDSKEDEDNKVSGEEVKKYFENELQDETKEALDKSVIKRKLRSQKSEDGDEHDKSESQCCVSDKSEEDDNSQKQSTDKSDDEVSRKKRKLDKDNNGENGVTRKNLRSSCSKVGDGIELD